MPQDRAPGPGPFPRHRTALDRMAGYRPSRATGAPAVPPVQLAANESPWGPPPEVVEAIGRAALLANRYPDIGCTELVARLGERLGVPEESVAVGCGSVGVAQMLVTAMAEPGTEVLYAWPSFEAYPLLTALSGATPVEVPLRDGAHDLAAMADAVTERTRLVFVCNPNNPTGTVVDGAALRAFADRVPDHCLVVIDEAYHEYVRDPDATGGLQLALERPNVVVLRTFSKAYGLAALRVGYLVGHPVVAGTVRKAYLPFSVSSLAQAAAVAALDAEKELLARVDTTVAERTRVRDALRGLGLTVPPSEANFLWLELGTRSAVFAEHCGRAGVVVRAVPGAGVRASVGSPAENDALLAAAATFGN